MAVTKNQSYQRLTVVAVALMVAVGAVIVALDWRQVTGLVGKASWPLLIAALATAAVSYFCTAQSVVVMLGVFGVSGDWSYLFRSGLVSVVLENLIAHPVGLSFRLLMLRRRGVDGSLTIGSAILHSYFKNILFLALIPISLTWVLFTHQIILGGTVLILLIIAILVVVVAGATVIVFSLRLRTVIFKGVARVWRFVTRRNIDAAIAEFGEALTEGIADLRQRPRTQLPLAVFVLTDVGAMIATLWLCFAALGVPIHLGALITGFNFGITLTVISFIPGDLGVQEASMAGVFALFGVPFGHGVLVAILFRVVYYFVPFVASGTLYWHLLRERGGDSLSTSD
jgi:uncharacterized protein (TIRG00374 family)